MAVTWLRERWLYPTGAFWEGGWLYLVRLGKKNARWDIDEQEKISFDLQTDDAERYGLLMEKIAARCQSRGWPLSALGLALSAGEVFLTDALLPSSLSDSEKKDALRWEIVGQAPASFVFNWDFCVLDEGLNRYRAAAVATKTVEQLTDTARDCDVRLCALTVYAGEENVLSQEEGFKEASHAALSCLKEYDHLEFLPQAAKHWLPLKELTALGISFSLLVTGLAAADDWWELNEAKKMLAERESHLALRQREREKMALATKLAADNQERTQDIQGLYREVQPWRSVLVHLSTMTVEGVWLERVVFSREGRVVLEGNALNYDVLGVFLEKYEVDRDFWRERPRLITSFRREDGGSIAFTLETKL